MQPRNFTGEYRLSGPMLPTVTAFSSAMILAASHSRLAESKGTTQGKLRKWTQNQDPNNQTSRFYPLKTFANVLCPCWITHLFYFIQILGDGGKLKSIFRKKQKSSFGSKRVKLVFHHIPMSNSSSPSTSLNSALLQFQILVSPPPHNGTLELRNPNDEFHFTRFPTKLEIFEQGFLHLGSMFCNTERIAGRVIKERSLT